MKWLVITERLQKSASEASRLLPCVFFVILNERSEMKNPISRGNTYGMLHFVQHDSTGVKDSDNRALVKKSEQSEPSQKVLLVNFLRKRRSRAKKEQATSIEVACDNRAIAPTTLFFSFCFRNNLFHDVRRCIFITFKCTGKCASALCQRTQVGCIFCKLCRRNFCNDFLIAFCGRLHT